jgi:glutamine phosphoribosylpyrophosphate amidotransferase
VTLAYLAKPPNIGDLIYLQSIRSGILKPGSLVIPAHETMVTFKYSIQLRTETQLDSVDAVASPPSTRTDAAPYREKFAGIASIDITERFSRRAPFKAGTSNDLDEVRASMSYASAGDESNLRSILIVDDILASGRTVSGMVSHLREAGASYLNEIYVAAPLWLPIETNA